MTVRTFLVALAVASATLVAAPRPARAQNLKDVIDQGLDELVRRQRPDGSYGGDAANGGDLVSTAEAVLAFSEAPRHYAETDGPFFRHAIEWLSKQVGPDGVPAGVKDKLEQIDVAGWLKESLALSRSAAGKEALARVDGFLGSDAVKNRGGPKLPAAVYARTFRLPAESVEEAVKALDPITQVLSSPREMRKDDWDRWYVTMPAIVRDLATRFPDLKLQTTSAGLQHWSKVMSSLVVGGVQAPAGFEEASPRKIAAACRALTICLAHLPKETGGAAPPPPKGTPRTVGADPRATYRDAAKAALAYLEGQQKNGRFGFLGNDDAGITALALAAVVRTSHRLGQPLPAYVDQGLDWLVSLQKKDGAIYLNELAVYVTSSSVLALTDAGRAKDKDAIAKATGYLKLVQRDERQGYDPKQDWSYGGIGYGDELRPDLSNTQFGLEALHQAGTPPSDPAMQKAILFLERCQNDVESNPQPVERADGKVVKSGTDGGAGYHPGDSKAGLIDRGDGTFEMRSYGSMTYALLKCYLFAGLKLDDPRVKTALNWIQGHWTVEMNPGFDPKSTPGAEYQGLFYYYFTLAKALDASGLDTLTTPDGKPHAWREELLRKLLSLSMNEGFWTNTKSARWMEEFPTLATSYALVAMDHCLGKQEGASR